MERFPAARKPSISLIIPAYNEEAYLPSCLDAIMTNVAGRVLEIIVVDNNSTDDTRSVIERYPVKYLFESMKGITHARQCGFLRSAGDILAFVDADTTPPAGWVDQITEAFQQDPRLATLSGPFRFYDLAGVRNLAFVTWFQLARPFFRISKNVIGGNFAIRRDVLIAMGGFDQSIEFYGEDVDIARRARKFGRVQFSPGFVMPTSGRRIQQLGLIRTAGIYLMSFMSMTLRGKPASQRYEDIR